MDFLPESDDEEGNNGPLETAIVGERWVKDAEKGKCYYPRAFKVSLLRQPPKKTCQKHPIRLRGTYGKLH